MSLNQVTVAFIFLHSGELEPIYTAALMALAMIGFHMSLFTTSRYYHGRYFRGPRDYLYATVFCLLGVGIMLGSGGDSYMVIVGCCVTVGGNFAYLLHKCLTYRDYTADE